MSPREFGKASLLSGPPKWAAYGVLLVLGGLAAARISSRVALDSGSPGGLTLAAELAWIGLLAYGPLAAWLLLARYGTRTGDVPLRYVLPTLLLATVPLVACTMQCLTVVEAWVSAPGIPTVDVHKRTAYVIAPLIEETGKALCVLWLLATTPYREKARLGFAGALMVGGAFGATENAWYILSYGDSSVSGLWLRRIAIPMEHAAFSTLPFVLLAGDGGWCRPIAQRGLLLAVGILLASCMHGIKNATAGLAVSSGLVFAYLVSIWIFLMRGWAVTAATTRSKP